MPAVRDRKENEVTSWPPPCTPSGSGTTLSPTPTASRTSYLSLRHIRPIVFNKRKKKTAFNTLCAEGSSHWWWVGSRSKNICRCLSNSSRSCWITWSLDFLGAGKGWWGFSVDLRKLLGQILGSLDWSAEAPWSRWNMTWPVSVSNCDLKHVGQRTALLTKRTAHFLLVGSTAFHTKFFFCSSFVLDEMNVATPPPTHAMPIAKTKTDGP